MLKMTMFRNDDLGRLLLRLGVGGLMIFHGIHKLFHGDEFIRSKLSEAGLPEFIALGVPVGEILAPALLILGLATRLSALTVAFTMLMSIFLAFSGRVWTLNQVGGWVIELNVLFMLSALAIFFLGSGRYAIDSKLPCKL